MIVSFCCWQNIALNAGAIQSSTYSTHSASLAVDGNINPGFEGVSSTLPDNPSFWEVDLNGSYVISKIFVFNGQENVSDRINGFNLKVLDAGNNAQYNYTDSDASTGRNLFEINLQGDGGIKEGSKVRIELSKALTDDNHLQLAEVMVFGEQVRNLNAWSQIQKNVFFMNYVCT